MLEDIFNKIDKKIKKIDTLNSANDFEESIKLYKEGIDLLTLSKKYLNTISLENENENVIENVIENEINLNLTINNIEKDLKLLDKKNTIKNLKKVYKNIIECKKKLKLYSLEINKIIINDKKYNIEPFNC